MQEIRDINIHSLVLLSASITALKNQIWNDSNAARRRLDAQFDIISTHIENLERLVGEDDDEQSGIPKVKVVMNQPPRRLQILIQVAIEDIFEDATATEIRAGKNPDDYLSKIDRLSVAECLQAKTSLNFIREQIDEVYAILRAQRYGFGLSAVY